MDARTHGRTDGQRENSILGLARLIEISVNLYMRKNDYRYENSQIGYF